MWFEVRKGKCSVWKRNERAAGGEGPSQSSPFLPLFTYTPPFLYDETLMWNPLLVDAKEEIGRGSRRREIN